MLKTKWCNLSATSTHPIRMGKRDVSVGEYDPVTGLTHVTHQRGRLLFNMGASVKKRQQRARPPPTTSSGSFTGLSLYPEEANYLLQRGALAVFLSPSEGEDAKELSVVEFIAMEAEHARVSLACMEVYTFLKDQKLHPRRYLEPSAASSGDGRCVPRHFVKGESCDVAFDVWKMVAVDVPSDDAKRPKQRKKLALVFRVVVCRFGDTAPEPHDLRQAMERSAARGCDDDTSLACVPVPVKLAVVHHDQSVLLFEISSQTTSTRASKATTT